MDSLRAGLSKAESRAVTEGRPEDVRPLTRTGTGGPPREATKSLLKRKHPSPSALHMHAHLVPCLCLVQCFVESGAVRGSIVRPFTLRIAMVNDERKPR